MHDTKMVQVDMPDDASLNVICELAHLHVVLLTFILSLFILLHFAQKDVLSEKLSAKEAHSVNETICRSSSIKALDERAIVDICTTSIDHTEPTNSSLKNQKNARIVIDRNAGEVIEQIERGIYFTFIALPDGKKGLKTVRFSRKHFNEEQAKIWWDKHGATALLKYNVEETAT